MFDINSWKEANERIYNEYNENKEAINKKYKRIGLAITAVGVVGLVTAACFVRNINKELNG